MFGDITSGSFVVPCDLRGDCMVNKKKEHGRVDEEAKKDVFVPRRRRQCAFCEAKKEPDYKDIEFVSRFVTDRGKIVARIRSGVCAKHQRRLSRAIKRARHLALLPFVVRPR